MDRKRQVCGDDRRLIGEYKMFSNDGDLQLWSEVRDP
jgi:hypothetical protein